MIAPPHYKCETVTLEKVKGFEKLEHALQVVEKVIKEKEGTFKLISKPQVIGAKDERDIDDLIANINEDREEEATSGQEDNEEGMGDIDLGEEEVEEEKKEQEKLKKVLKKKAKGEDEEDSDQ